MTATKFARLACSTIVALLLPVIAAAQSSTFIVPLDRTGYPGTATVTQIDPLTGQAQTVVIDTGAFDNPCTLEYVDVFGNSTITTQQSVDKFGTTKVNVGVVSKGTGLGWVDVGGTQTFTGSTYAFSETQRFVFRLPSVGEQFSADFVDKLAMKGARSTDNWIIRAKFRIHVASDGTVKVYLIKKTADTCRG
jgi:hypothetical protein